MIGGVSEVAEKVVVAKAGIIFVAEDFVVDDPEVSLANEFFLFEGGGKFLHEIESLDEGLFVVVVSELVVDSLEDGFDDGGIEGDLLFELLFEFGLEGEEDFLGVFVGGECPVLLFEVLHDGQVLLLSGAHRLDL